MENPAEIALDTLYCHLSGRKPTKKYVAAIDSPLFVTYELDGDLRGCIGTFGHQDLRGLCKSALVAALQDRRFAPITLEEFPHLECHVTLLQDFRDITAEPYDWQIGVHGIELELQDAGGLSATFLPSVAEEQGWTQQETFTNLIRKAGAAKRGARARLEDFRHYKVTRYTGVKSEMTARDYLDAAGVTT